MTSSENQFQLSKSKFIDICINRDIREDYDVIKKLGSGAYGIVYLVTDKRSGEQRAVKAIHKVGLEQNTALQNEIAILKSLDHPNILKLYDIYDFRNVLYLVTEYCQGGELFYYFTKAGSLSEAQAARIMRQIFSAVLYLHANRIVHRDLKPENFLLKYENDDSAIKLIDFGLSRKLRENEILNNPDGTPFYVAPEVLTGNSSETSDNWSLGVILYIILGGAPPFGGKDNREILQAVQRGIYTFALKPFRECSIEVKDLISKLLVKNTEKRYTASEAYNHSWVQQQVDKESKNLVINPNVFEKLKGFLSHTALKKATMLYIATKVPEVELTKLKEYFLKVDTNGNGMLTLEEMKKAFRLLSDASNLNIDSKDIQKLFYAIDTNRNEVIDYTEFLSVFMDSHIFSNEKYLRDFFGKCDKDKSGKINREEIKELLGGGEFVSINTVDEIIQAADTNNDGEIDYNELLRYIKLNNLEHDKDVIYANEMTDT